MKIYLTSGTADYLLKVKNKHHGENMLLMGDDDSSIILHETNGDTLFNQARKYEVFDSEGTFDQAGFAEMSYIPVVDESRPLFEYRFLQQPQIIENQPGFVAIRAMRPSSSNTYVILTLWENQGAYSNWKASSEFQVTHKKLEEQIGAQPSPLYSSAPYITTYSIVEEE